MAKYHHGILGSFSGCVGDIVGYLKNGKQVIRKRPGPRVDKPGEVQQQQRERFKIVGAFLRPVNDLLKVLPKYGKTGNYYWAFSEVSRNAVLTNKDGSPGIDFPAVRLCPGNVHVSFKASVRLDQGRLIFEYERLRQQYLFPNFHLMAYNPGQGCWYFQEFFAKEHKGKVSFNVDKFLVRGIFHFYLILTDPGNRKVSASFYAGSVELPSPGELRPVGENLHNKTLHNPKPYVS